MKLFVRFAAAGAVALATPALALPNAFWTFGWKMPGRDMPWSIGDARTAPAALAAAAPVKPITIASLAYDFRGL